LLLASLISWTLIFSKKSQIGTSKKQLDKLVKAFNHNMDVDNLLRSENAGIIKEVYAEVEPSDKDSIQKSYHKFGIFIDNQINKLEDKMQIIAIIASSSPYIGLFGTVWGIMHSFLSLASVKQATIAIVAPGIAEALIATACGLFAAIPANIFYNKFSSDIDDIYNKYRSLASQYLILVQK
jgi:biopolymer transport protein TolQ